MSEIQRSTKNFQLCEDFKKYNELEQGPSKKKTQSSSEVEEKNEFKLTCMNRHDCFIPTKIKTFSDHGESHESLFKTHDGQTKDHLSILMDENNENNTIKLINSACGGFETAKELKKKKNLISKSENNSLLTMASSDKLIFHSSREMLDLKNENLFVNQNESKKCKEIKKNSGGQKISNFFKKDSVKIKQKKNITYEKKGTTSNDFDIHNISNDKNYKYKSIENILANEERDYHQSTVENINQCSPNNKSFFTNRAAVKNRSSFDSESLLENEKTHNDIQLLNKNLSHFTSKNLLIDSFRSQSNDAIFMNETLTRKKTKLNTEFETTSIVNGVAYSELSDSHKYDEISPDVKRKKTDNATTVNPVFSQLHEKTFYLLKSILMEFHISSYIPDAAKFKTVFRKIHLDLLEKQIYGNFIIHILFIS